MHSHAPQNPVPRSAHWLASLGQAAVVLGTLAAGVFGSKALSAGKAPPTRTERPRTAPLVEALAIEPGTIELWIEGQGTLQAHTELALAAQVGGRVVEVHPDLRAGGRFAADELLLRLETVDFELALAQAKADVAAAQTQLSNQRAEASAALAEWQALHGEKAVPALVSRQPQIAEAEARLQSAEAKLERAELDLKRTEVRLPFAVCVLSANVSAGDLIAAGASLGRVYDATRFEIPVPIEDHELKLLAVPGLNAAPGAGSLAEATLLLAGQEHHCSGRVVRLEGRIDPRSRLARVVVEVAAPRQVSDGPAIPLLPGAFARVRLAAEPLHDVVAVSRQHLHDQGVVWVEQGGKLEFLTPEVVHAGDGEVYLRGLPRGARLVTSPLEVVTPGMALRVAGGNR
jgi:RND family efflux transporter MFP subunit